ncbi:MAG: PilZ domain-containing protein [Thermoanaerobaculia bacterium]
MAQSRRERRKRQRVQLARPLVGRVGTLGVLVVDVSESGARVEHYTRLKTGQSSRFRLESEHGTIHATCIVVSCKVHRFAPGDDGLTVYQSGLLFTDFESESATVLKKVVGVLVTRGLAEQVANARGVGPVTERDMPTFRSGVVALDQPESAEASKNKHLIPDKRLAHHRGFIRCRLVKNRWDRKWTFNPEQPDEGFTVLATEPIEQIDLLCKTYVKSDVAGRELIRKCAEASMEGES